MSFSFMKVHYFLWFADAPHVIFVPVIFSAKVSAVGWRLAGASHLGGENDCYSGRCGKIQMYSRYANSHVWTANVHFGWCWIVVPSFFRFQAIFSVEDTEPILFLLSTVLKEGATVVDASATLGKFVNDELLHIQDSGGQSLEPSWFTVQGFNGIWRVWSCILI